MWRWWRILDANHYGVFVPAATGVALLESRFVADATREDGD
jgi:hypothetical protein